MACCGVLVDDRHVDIEFPGDHGLYGVGVVDPCPSCGADEATAEFHKHLSDY